MALKQSLLSNGIVVYHQHNASVDNVTALLMVGDANSSNHINPQHSENDDSVMHRGLTYTALTQNGKSTNAPLIIAEVKNSSIEYLTSRASSYLVPSLLAQSMIEADYSIKASKTTVTRGALYSTI